MTNENKVIEYLNGDMSQQEREGFEQLLKSDLEVKNLLDKYRPIFNGLDHLENIKPSEGLRSNVLTMINQAAEKKTITKSSGWKWIGMISFLFLVVAISYFINGTKQSINVTKKIPQKQFDLYNPSVTSRIHAVSLNESTTSNSNDVIKTLIKVLNEDKSSNVRLATVRVMQQHLQNEMTRVALVNALGQEKDPFVLIEIINTLARHKEKSAIGALEQLTKENGLEKFIKDEAHLGLFQIQEY